LELLDVGLEGVAVGDGQDQQEGDYMFEHFILYAKLRFLADLMTKREGKVSNRGREARRLGIRKLGK
jgi:hypothetical protein